MTIQRQYSLPNCTLGLEGLSSAIADSAAQAGRPSLDILMRFECHLFGQEKPLIGGRDLLENLAAAASQCAQEVLSGIRRADRFTLNGQSPLVHLKPIDTNLFRLVVPPELLVDASLLPLGGSAPEHDAAKKALPIEMHLSIVQVFDLVEAFDQLLADTQTLPDLSLKFGSLSKREAASQQPIAKQVAPVALGVTSLGIAGVAFFFIPVPEVRKPQSPAPQTPPQAGSERPSSPLIPTPNPPEPSPNRRSSLVAPLASAPMITERQQLAELNQKLYTQIAQVWKTKPTFNQDLIYRVGVDQSGQIVGYRPMNQAAIDFKQEVPLLDLLNVPVPASAAVKPEAVTQKALAQFQVVFTASGVLQVRPWGEG
jgi:hypothetical protein